MHTDEIVAHLDGAGRSVAKADRAAVPDDAERQLIVQGG